MKILKFKECNITYAEHQPPYQPLPAHRFKEGEVVSCWGLSLFERLKMLLTGKIWVSVLTFNRRLQPLLVSVNKPFKPISKDKI